MSRLKISAVAGVLVVAATMLAGAAGGAGGPISHVGGIVRTNDVTPNLGGGNLTYHGGPVMHTNKTYAIYWVPPGYSMPASYKSTINQYFTDVAAASGATSNVYAVETQYYDTAPNPSPGNVVYSSTFGGAVTDTGALPANGCDPAPLGTVSCITDAQIIAKIHAVTAAQGWTENATNQFFLFTPQGVGSCFDPQGGQGCSYTAYCAYHGYDANLIYANQPYAAVSGCDTGERPNGDPADATINVTSHEHREAINDRRLDAWYDNVGYEGLGQVRVDLRRKPGSGRCPLQPDDQRPKLLPPAGVVERRLNVPDDVRRGSTTTTTTTSASTERPCGLELQPGQRPCEHDRDGQRLRLHERPSGEVQRQARLAVARPVSDEASRACRGRLDDGADLRDHERRHRRERIELHRDRRVTTSAAASSTSTSATASSSAAG